MSLKTKPLNQLNDEAISLLIRELGVADTARFIRQFTTGSGNYTEDRKGQFEGQTVDSLLKEIEERRGSSTA